MAFITYHKTGRSRCRQVEGVAVVHSLSLLCGGWKGGQVAHLTGALYLSIIGGIEWLRGERKRRDGESKIISLGWINEELTSTIYTQPPVNLSHQGVLPAKQRYMRKGDGIEQKWIAAGRDTWGYKSTNALYKAQWNTYVILYNV